MSAKRTKPSLIPVHPNGREATPEEYGTVFGIATGPPFNLRKIATPANEPKYGYIDQFAVRFTDTEAWWFVNGEWKRLEFMEALATTRLLSKAEFDKAFEGDHLTALPTTAFQPGDKPMPAGKIRYGSLESIPVIFDDVEAWWLVKGEWKRLNLAEAWDAALLSKEEFDAMTGHLRAALPKTAFQSGDSLS